MNSSLHQVAGIVNDGKAVLAGSDEEVTEIVKQVIQSGRSATFFLAPTQAAAVRAWYKSAAKLKKREKTSREEVERIRSELGIEDFDESFEITRVECRNCGHFYGAFEFVQQGIREHGHEMIETVFSRKDDVSVLQVNQAFELICPSCESKLSPPSEERAKTAGEIIITIPGYDYECRYYGCCQQI